ncbi:hypothetical protein O9992_26945 [Vibrio lentus]|nr:hypothetical protein [Vibrio lentus]
MLVLKQAMPTGKSVRTVKSCVGSTWCRYGVDDSVGFSDSTQRTATKAYAHPTRSGLLFLAVRAECAEAQSKDFWH